MLVKEEEEESIKGEMHRYLLTKGAKMDIKVIVVVTMMTDRRPYR